MKRLLAALFVLIMLTGCAENGAELSRAMALREKLLKSNGCCFDAVITADYGEKIYTFGMKCEVDASGNLSFEVTEPATISGITGTISEKGGALKFDDQVLAFETLADGQITPVSAPWLLIHTLRSGYINACGENGSGLHMQIDDSYAEDALHMDIWTEKNDLPIRCEILWQGRRIVSIDVKDFTIV